MLIFQNMLTKKTIDFQSIKNNFIYLTKREKYSMADVYFWPESED